MRRLPLPFLTYFIYKIFSTLYFFLFPTITGPGYLLFYFYNKNKSVTAGRKNNI